MRSGFESSVGMRKMVSEQLRVPTYERIHPAAQLDVIGDNLAARF
jgi:hypothetical protein